MPSISTPRAPSFALLLLATACDVAGTPNGDGPPLAATTTAAESWSTDEQVAVSQDPSSPLPTDTGPTPVITHAGRANDAPVTFDWPDVDPSSGHCQPGYYLGSFDGLYASGLTFAGVPIPVAGDVNMFLERSPNGEFLEIQNGAVCGVADGAFPFYGELVGELDCTTGQLHATMEGGYLVGVIPGPFEGFLVSGYDFFTQSLNTGIWCLKENGIAAPGECDGGAWPMPYGGSGHWNATWVSDTPGVPCVRPPGL